MNGLQNRKGLILTGWHSVFNRAEFKEKAKVGQEEKTEMGWCPGFSCNRFFSPS